jgi:diguanylate cyclase (GGDEF)-like protein
MQLSYRHRLTLFFLLIVVLPMVALAVLVVSVSGDSRTGKADARLGAGIETALSVYEQDARDAQAMGTEIARDPALAAALRSGDRAQVEAMARRLQRQRDLVALRIADANGRPLASTGPAELIAPAQVNLEAPDGSNAGTLTASTTTVNDYVVDVQRLTGEEAAILDSSGGSVGGTVATQGLDLPDAGEASDVEVEGEDLRAVVSELSGPGGLQIALFGPVESGGFLASSPGVAAALVAFFAIALVFILMLRRTLQQQVETMLGAARRIGEGDFSKEVPVQGRDEMAGLASEFNKMSDRLTEQMDQLRSQRVEIERSVRRIGEAFAAGLERQALLGIVVETAVGACEAEYGLIALSGRSGAEAEAGKPSAAMHEAALAAEERTLREPEEVVAAEAAGARALSGPLVRLGRPSDAIGAMTVVRTGEPFSAAQRDVFRYLLGQASASVENVALHELVSEQAVTDELTGLSNNRAFREWINREAARAERFSHHLSLLMLDIDDFKAVNDEHGHLQGDEVLRMIGRVMSAEARAVDQPARYGGEEFVVALPETDAEGALEVGERLRSRIESEPVPGINGDAEIRVTASIGAATIPASAADVHGLIAAADEALYAAKRAGKNRVVAAGATRAARADGTHPASPGEATKGPAGARRR